MRMMMMVQMMMKHTLSKFPLSLRSWKPLLPCLHIYIWLYSFGPPSFLREKDEEKTWRKAFCIYLKFHPRISAQHTNHHTTYATCVCVHFHAVTAAWCEVLKLLTTSKSAFWICRVLDDWESVYTLSLCLSVVIKSDLNKRLCHPLALDCTKSHKLQR